MVIASCAVCGVSRAWISADMPGVNGMWMSASGRHQNPRSARITRKSCASDSIAPAAKVWPCSAATVIIGRVSIRANSACTSAT